MTANEDILDGAVRHLHWLERYKSGEVRRMLALLQKADDDLVRIIAERLTRIGRGAVLSKAETERLKKLLADIRQAKKEAGAALYESAAGQLAEFAAHEADFKARLIEGATADAGLALAQPSAAQLRAVVTARPFQGRLLREWYSSLAEGQGRQITDAIRIGITEGQTNDQIVRRIRGTKALRFKDGVLETGRREAAAVVRTSIAHVANVASERLYEENEDIIEGVQWVSTLDGRTTATCRARDGKVFGIGQGPRPPAHWNCRSTTVPYLGAVEGMRASATGQIPRTTTYEQWLRSQPATFQDEVLGKGKAKLFRNQKYSLDRFIDPTGREYTLQQLRQIDQ